MLQTELSDHRRKLLVKSSSKWENFCLNFRRSLQTYYWCVNINTFVYYFPPSARFYIAARIFRAWLTSRENLRLSIKTVIQQLCISILHFKYFLLEYFKRHLHYIRWFFVIDLFSNVLDSFGSLIFSKFSINFENMCLLSCWFHGADIFLRHFSQPLIPRLEFYRLKYRINLNVDLPTIYTCIFYVNVNSNVLLFLPSSRKFHTPLMLLL